MPVLVLCSVLVSTLMGPSADTAGRGLEIVGKLRDIAFGIERWDEEKADLAASTVRFAYNNLPFSNLFYTRWAMDHFLMNHV